jgi:DNA-binding NarL/FixJ family response regulator
VHSGGVYLSAGIATNVFHETHAFDGLTRRERQVLHMVGLGRPSKTIANTLHLSVRTVESHRQSIKRKLQLDDHVSLIKFAVQHVGHFGLPG